MNEDQIIAERLLFLIEIFPPDIGFYNNDRDLSILLNIKIQKIKDIIQELLETGFIKRNRVNGTRVLFSLRSEKEKSIAIIKLNLYAKFSDSVQHTPKETEERKEERKEKEKRSKKEKEKKEVKKEEKEKLLFINDQQEAWPAAMLCNQAEEKRVGDVLPKTIEKHIILWNSLHLKKCWTVEVTKILRTTISNFRRLKIGTLFTDTLLDDVKDKFTDEDIIESIKNFAKAVIEENYEPRNGTPYHTFLKRIDLHKFLFASYSKSRIGTSLFYHYLKNPPKQIPIEGVIPDQYPEITKVFKRYYILNILAGVIPTNGFSPKDEDNFRMATIKTFEFYQRNKSLFSRYQIMGGVNQKVLAEWVCEAVMKDNGGFEITSGWFSSDTTFNKRLPRYLTNQGIIEADL